MKYYLVTYLGNQKNYSIVKVLEETHTLVLTEVMASSDGDDKKYRAFSKEVWNSDRVKPLDSRLFPTFVDAAYTSEEFTKIIKEM
jgi:uncharacterized protein